MRIEFAYSINIDNKEAFENAVAETPSILISNDDEDEDFATYTIDIETTDLTALLDAMMECGKQIANS